MSQPRLTLEVPRPPLENVLNSVRYAFKEGAFTELDLMQVHQLTGSALTLENALAAPVHAVPEPMEPEPPRHGEPLKELVPHDLLVSYRFSDRLRALYQAYVQMEEREIERVFLMDREALLEQIKMLEKTGELVKHNLAELARWAQPVEEPVDH